MATYVILFNWTDQGVKQAQGTIERVHRASELFESMGAKITQMYWTLGRFDVVGICEAPDDETMAAAALKLSTGGNSRTETLRAFDEQAMAQILQRIS